jgi:putative NADH-flavin reductase
MQDTRPLPETSPSHERPQRLLVFGASGKTGRVLSALALERGFSVGAFARHPERLELEHPALRRHPGDVLDPAAVHEALRGYDAVVIALGAPIFDRSGLRTRGTRNIVSAMEGEGIHRLVCLTVLGIDDSWANLPWSYQRLVMPLLLRRALDDHKGQEAAIRESTLDWTIVRPPNLTDAPATGETRHGFSAADGVVGMHVPRADVASFMLDQLDHHRYSRRAAGITASIGHRA